MDAFYIILAYLYIVNLAELALFGVDKRRAKRGLRRIPEATLLGLAVAGGSIGALGGMFLFRHKTRKPRFRIGIPVILVMELLFFLGVIWVTSL